MTLSALTRCSFLSFALFGANCFAAAVPVAADMDIPSGLSVPAISVGSGAKLTDLTSSTPDFLARVKAANEALYSNLQSFVCNEEMDRFKGSFSGDNARRVDTVTTKLSFESGVERYSDIFQDKRSRTSIASVAGAWSEGEFGTLLQQTQILLNTQPVLFRMNTTLEGRAAAVYEVQISEENSPWDLEVEHHHYKIPFRTEIWVSQATGQIMRIVRITSGIPSKIGISEIRWGVTLQEVQLNDRSWLLPKTGSYVVLYAGSDRREWNELTFSGYQRYGAETALRFQ